MNKKLEHDLNKEKGVVVKMITQFCNSPFIPTTSFIQQLSQSKVTSTASSVKNIRETSAVYLDTLYPFGFLTAFSVSSSSCFLI